ncbi:hypothetical protein V6N13_131267 [Hibiscus sabdariffa]|uniref:Uncharacterized protein n=1 Tax=Hibiscus sabdariffa TaxID=183260 RepID=A0ABR2DA67_9ROSI
MFERPSGWSRDANTGPIKIQKRKLPIDHHWKWPLKLQWLCKLEEHQILLLLASGAGQRPIKRKNIRIFLCPTSLFLLVIRAFGAKYTATERRNFL